MHRALTMTAALLFATPLLAQDETEISINDVPENILDVAINTAPGVTFDRVSIEVENGVSIYEFEARDHNGNHIEIDVTEDGELDEIEMEIDESDLPASVLQTLNDVAPGFEATYIELSVRAGGAEFVYEFEGRIEGSAVDIEIAENGELLFISDDMMS
ncbi:hypothetical protein PUV54_15725 [Hyphococcus flavus]|uniref:PepSY domain-containing protein n=1 Tax=Hyphococcus flavus TaxID=1866326 RepID=A0AAE9ZBA1_9PROT|nr:hypothetical protein [Hyphococcus flavus]WDI31399.1 hypothetical protein PUV54_15725 [Hyphococcus flavus]